MSLVSLSDAHFDYGRERILSGISLAIHPGTRYALVGDNGAGKTTLLAALAGELDLPGGVRQAMGSARIRMLRQESALKAGDDESAALLPTVAETAFGRERSVERELHEVSRLLETAAEQEQAPLVARQGKLQDEFERLQGYTMQSRLESALRGVGLPEATWSTPVVQLSGGERRRAALAVVLLSGAELLLLDEPTNHLDLDSCEWLESHLEGYRGSAVIVSHDRQFLDRVTQKTLHLDRGRLNVYSGNYSFFDEQSRLRYQQELNAWQRQQTRIRQTEEYIRRNIEGQNTKQAQSRRRQLAKEEVLPRPSTEPGLYRFHLQPVRPSGGTVLETRGLAKSFAQRVLFKGLDLHVSRGDRVGIVGPNGCGKSTLLKLIAGLVLPDEGRVVLGHNVDLGYYDQELSGVADHNSVIAEMAAVDPRATVAELRSFLGAFGFGEDLFDREVGRLSGGERGRLSLLRLIKEGHNTLLLDEPTNHLDVRSRESLEAALAEFTGTLIVVSHDRRFLNKIVDKLVVFTAESGGPRIFDGTYADYVRDRALQAAPARDPAARTGKQAAGRTAGTPATAGDVAGAPGGARGALSKNEIGRRLQWIAEVEEQILALESERDAALSEMGAGATTNERRVGLARRCQEIENELREKMGRWERWHLEIEEGSTA